MLKPILSNWNDQNTHPSQQDYFYSSGDLIIYDTWYFGVILSRGNLEYTYKIMMWPIKEDGAWKYRKWYGDDGEVWGGITITDYNSKLLVSGAR